MKRKIALGIDIGGTNTVFGLVDEHGKILVKDTISTESFALPEDFAAVVSEHSKKLLASLGNDVEFLGAGIGAPSANFYTGCLQYPPNLKWKGIVPLRNYFEERMNCKIILTNDAKAAALGEMLFGAAKGMKDFLFITLGTGLGSGIVVNGNLVYGNDGMAGEVGHVIMEKDGRQCGCGRKGCLETYCSATGIRRTYTDLLMSKHEKTSAQGRVADAKYIYDKAMAGEEAAIEAFHYTGEILGLALANSVTYTSPEAIFLFGGLAQSGELIFKPTIESFKRNLFNVYRNEIKIIPSQLNENDAAILGAASLIWKENK